MPLITLLLQPLLADVGAESVNLAEVGPLISAAVLLSLVVIYFASKVGGEICARINFPPVLGELVGGVVVGTSVLHLLVFSEGGATEPAVLTTFIQQTASIDGTVASVVANTASEVISVLSEIGVMILLFEIGLESDLEGLLKVGPQAAVVAVVGVVAPFAAGTLGLVSLFHVDLVPAIFAGAALTATSIGITAKVLAEIQRLTSPEGQIIIGAAVLDDILGIIVLAVVASLAKTGTVEISNVIYLIISSVVFLVGSVVVGRLLSPLFLGMVDRLSTRGNLLVPSLIFAFVLGYVAVILQLEAILGAFTAGLVLGETEKRRELEEQILPIADMLVPVFFVCVGARTDISVLNPLEPANRAGLIIASFLVLVAIVGKVVTGATVFGQPGINRWAIGIGMVPRGEVGLIFAAVGSASGVLSKALDASIIVMVIVTTFIAPPLLRLVFKPEATEALPTSDIAVESPPEG
ncbi:MAG: sodium:proton antiporter [Thermosynechococcus sp.]|uniref:cation:proton antiporter n=1 Tax=Thermosynechococcus sp. TaxID=2814275 RepID=UPI0021FBED32|nr:cation:proton antiporter [Thermosynechococcus sp.]BCX11381.1 MAG: sodium:proton antiporter [Thermosynechococcus sp.]